MYSIKSSIICRATTLCTHQRQVQVTENKISNDTEQDIYTGLPQIIVTVITPSNQEEWTASIMILPYKGKGDPTESGSFSWN